MAEAKIDRTILLNSVIHSEMASNITAFEEEVKNLYDILNGVPIWIRRPYSVPLTARTIIEQIVTGQYVLEQVLGGTIAMLLRM